MSSRGCWISQSAKRSIRETGRQRDRRGPMLEGDGSSRAGGAQTILCLIRRGVESDFSLSFCLFLSLSSFWLRQKLVPAVLAWRELRLLSHLISHLLALSISPQNSPTSTRISRSRVIKFTQPRNTDGSLIVMIRSGHHVHGCITLTACL